MSANRTTGILFSEDDFQVVRELKGGHLLYPKNIPDDRGHVALILQIMLTILLLIVCTYFAARNRVYSFAIKYTCVVFVIIITSILFQGYCTAAYVLLITLIAYLWRVCNLSEELRHVHARYDGSVGAVFTAALKTNTLSIVIIVLCLALFVGMWLDVGNPLTYLWTFGPEASIFSLMSSLLIIRLLNIDECRLDTTLKLMQSNGLDYGSSHAYSYFYGYLNIVLPSLGDENKGLYENIEDYESRENVKIPVKKLIILIPTSLRIPPDLKEVSYNWMESLKKMTSVVKTRAGTKERTYHNTVYKIHPGGIGSGSTPVYVVTEGATPLLTFYEVLQHSGKDSTAYNDYRKEILGSFYRTLRHIIKSKPEVRDLCELIFYEDVDANGKKVNVAKILLQRIQEEVALAS